MKRLQSSPAASKENAQNGTSFRTCGYLIVCAMMSSVHGLDFDKVREANAQLLEGADGQDPAHIGVCNIKRETDPKNKTRLRYTREVRLRNSAASVARQLCNALNAAEDTAGNTSDVWHIREENGWTIVFAGDPEHSPTGEDGEPRWSRVGGRKKTEWLIAELLNLL